MSKILICGDIHFSTYSSILRKRGEFYSERLENLLWSINWVEKTAEDNKCNRIIYLGDFFDKASLDSEELTALQDIKWSSNIIHYFLVGNHEMGRQDLAYSSAHLLNLIPNSAVIDQPTTTLLEDYYLTFIPYILESNRKPLIEYLKDVSPQKNLIFSHNDLKGINYGQFISKDGFDIEEINSNCKYYFNGHIHNGEWISSTILNVGNLTGQNFSEDAFRYTHGITIYDTETDKLTHLENPFAYNFYKIEKIDDNFCNLSFKRNAVLSIKCRESKVKDIKEFLDNNPYVANYRIITIPEEKDVSKIEVEDLTHKDYIEEFKNYVIENIGKSDALFSELQEICK